MRKVKNITVCVTPEIYREARLLAAEHDSTVSALVAWLLPHMRVSLERTHFPKGGPKPSAQPTPAVNALVTPPPPPSPRTLPTPTPGSSQEQAPACGSLTTDHCSLTTGGESAKTGCETVPAHLTNKDSAACSHRAAPVQPL
jgi:hypothetical protein